ncbi:TPA: hypothetical protein N0F65_000379 [Lagenidium giganteum]|uniref:Transposase n=1 Tax=Lagenidium giganteum TaxID=4803 RepID=A0AAV2YYG0_9STRA|nr:TPA: hypothetical protein N0F65_000379 [Lagenidium giganteum]
MGRGRRHITKPKDAFLMMLTVLKHYDTWEKHASDFSMRTSTFEKLVGKMIDFVEPILFSHSIRPVTIKEQRDRQMVSACTLRDRCQVPAR